MPADIESSLMRILGQSAELVVGPNTIKIIYTCVSLIFAAFSRCLNSLISFARLFISRLRPHARIIYDLIIFIMIFSLIL